MVLSELNLEEVTESSVMSVLYDVPADFTGTGDYILVLGSSVFGQERVEKAVQIYQRGQASKIIFSGGLGKDGTQPEALIMKEYAMKLGVPEDAILVETQSNNTVENIAATLLLLTKEGPIHRIKRILVVTNFPYVKRVMLTIPYYAPAWLSFGYCYEEMDVETLRNNAFLYEAGFREVRKMIRYAKEKAISDCEVCLPKD